MLSYILWKRPNILSTKEMETGSTDIWCQHHDCNQILTSDTADPQRSENYNNFREGQNPKLAGLAFCPITLGLQVKQSDRLVIKGTMWRHSSTYTTTMWCNIFIYIYYIFKIYNVTCNQNKILLEKRRRSRMTQGVITGILLDEDLENLAYVSPPPHCHKCQR